LSESHYVVLAGLQLAILLPQLPEHSDYRYAPSSPTISLSFSLNLKKKIWQEITYLPLFSGPYAFSFSHSYCSAYWGIW
jgi:hypothetical protein